MIAVSASIINFSAFLEFAYFHVCTKSNTKFINMWHTVFEREDLKSWLIDLVFYW